MKQNRISKAYKAIVQMYKRTGVPFGICNQLFMLKKKLEPYYELQGEKESEILKAHGWENEMIGRVPYTPEILKEFKEIQEAEVEYEGEPVEIRITEAIAEKLGITGEIIDMVDGFITFTEG